MTAERLSSLVKQRAAQLGFDAVGIADLTPPPHGDRLTAWLEKGMAGTMNYMHRQAGRRLQPARILPGATRAVVVTSNYFQKDPVAVPAGGGLVAKYARGRDYHATLRPLLEDLTLFIKSLGPPATVAKGYIDAGPVPERELAQRAGLGWIGKNTLLIDPRRGSFFFLATVLTNLDLAIDLPFEADRCGSCRRCLDACPTQAFPESRVLDSRRCISYLTIEHRGEIDGELASSMGAHVFGCDICQDVCPWNVSFAEEALGAGIERDPDLAILDLGELSKMPDDAFVERYSATPLERPGPEGMRRNARIALANGKAENPCPIP
jgi:epoxyqueuosine reductase